MADLQEQFAKRNEAWEGRVKALGVDRAIYHNGHPRDQLHLIDLKQYNAIVPHLLNALREDPIRVTQPSLTLDFGCGHGRWSPTLAQITGGNVIACDPTFPLLEHAEATNPHDRVQYLHYHDGQIPVAMHRVDLLWCCMVLSTILADDMFEHTLGEFRRVLKPGAIVCLTDNTSKVNGQPVRSPYSISRSIDTYRKAFDWCDLVEVDHYEDLGEINTVFLGKVK